jgi:hypothetical protein
LERVARQRPTAESSGRVTSAVRPELIMSWSAETTA